jgi:outer membrane receptor protein involved in Fe transport
MALDFQGGIDFFINNKNTLSISGRYYDRDFAHVSDSYYHEWSLPSTSDSYYLRKSESGFGGKNYNLSLDYNLKFAKPEQKLDFSFTYAKRDGVRKNDLFEYVTDASKNIDNDYDPILNKQDETGPDNDFRFKVDFVSPVGNSGMIEAGYQGRYEKEDEKSVYSTFNALNNTWEVNPARSNEINSTNNIQALYATWASKVLGFEYKVGIRGEYNFRTLYPVSGDNYEYKRFEIFPDAYLTRQLSKTQQIQLSYSRRINRPDGRELDPFINWSDPDRPRGGNPELEPEYVDSYELNFQQQLSKSFISLETYFRRTNNLITDITIDWGDGILFRTYENQNYDNSLGIELNANIFLTQWWRLNASGTGFYYQLSGASDAVDVLKESFNYNFRFDNSFTLKKKTRIQITGFYRGPQVTVQGERKAVFFSNIAARQDFLKGKMTATLQIQDIFGASGWKFTEQTEFYRAEMNFTREPRVVTFSITYRLNNFKQKRNGNGEGREDMEMDMDMGM